MYKFLLSFCIVGTLMLSQSFAVETISINVNKVKIAGGESITGRIGRSGDTTKELAVKLESTNPSLVKFSSTEVRLRPGETSSVPFQISSVPTQIKTSVTIRAIRQSGTQPGTIANASVPALKTIEIVPAILASVSLNRTSMNGTHGNKIDCKVDLNAPAPPGGIELYLSPLVVSSLAEKELSLNIPNPRVQAGSRSVTFGIEYDSITQLGVSVSDEQSFSKFNNQTRTVELVVGLDPQQTKPWQAIPGIANKVTFDVVPLRVASLSVQPASVRGGAEALATFTLNVPPGNNESARLPRQSTKAWPQLPGSSCQPNVPPPSEMSLTPGVTSYSFKVCTASVTTPVTVTLQVATRGGSNQTQITVQP